MKHVILGNGPAGVIASETIRKHAPNDEIVLVGAEPEPPYSRMAIPYLLTGKIDEAGTYLRKDPAHFDRLGIRLKTARREVRERAGADPVARRRRHLELRSPARRHRLGPRAPAHPGDRSPRRTPLLDLGGRAQDHGARPARRPRAADGGRLHRLHHHGGHGGPRSAAHGRRDGRPHGAAHDGAGRGRDDQALGGEEGHRRAHLDARRGDPRRRRGRAARGQALGRPEGAGRPGHLRHRRRGPTSASWRARASPATSG